MHRKTPRTPSRRRSARAGAALAAVAILAAACGGGDEEVVEAPPETPPSTEMVTTTQTIPEPTWPLTGQVQGDAPHAGAPAVAVKIDNNHEARPHAGLALADVVFEVKVEGITRFGAVFHSQAADPVGPIRSARSTDIDLLANLNRPLLVWSGGNPGVTSQVQHAQGENLLVDVGPNTAPGNYWRQPGRPPAPHNLFGNVSAFRDQFAPEGATAPSPIFDYRDDATPPAIGTDVPGLQIDFQPGSVVQYVWDGPGSCWRRFQDAPNHHGPASAFMDETHGQICPENVVVLFAHYRPSDVDARSPQAESVGEGDALVATGGKLVSGRWARPDRGAPYTITSPDGAPIGLTPGNTWVAIPENGSGVGGLAPDVAAQLAGWFR